MRGFEVERQRPTHRSREMAAPKRIDEAVLTDIARRATDHKHDAAAGCSCMDALRLVSEVRRLRQLVVEAKPYVPENEQTHTFNLVGRLKAEVDCG
jgi:hypothetical protein